MAHCLSVRKQAEIDIRNAVEFYDEIDRGLGDRFLDDLSNALTELSQNPAHHRVYYKNFRRVLLLKFPYKIFYQIMSEQVVVFRILHARQCHQRKIF